MLPSGPPGREEPEGHRGLAGSTLLALARSASGALVAVALPLVMSHLLTDDRFAVWTIAVQAFAYGTFLESGITLAVSRAAAAHRRDDLAPVSVVLRAGWQLVRLPVAVAVIAYGALVALLPVLYGRIPDPLVTSARVCVVLMALGSVTSLAALPAQGYLQGVGRFGAALVPMVGGTIVAATGAAGAAAGGAPLWVCATVFAGARALSSLVIARMARSHARAARRLPVPVGSLRSVMAELRATVATLWIWSLGGFLGSGLDLTIVSWADYPAVRPYAIGAAITAALSGVSTALVTVLVPRMARTTAEAGRARPLDVGAEGRIAAWSISSAALPVVAMAVPLSHALDGDPTITLVLLAGAWLRVSMTPFVAALLGTGDHRLLRRSPLVEGIANVTIGVVLAPIVGAVGVAIATLVSGAYGVGMHLFRNIPRSSLAHIRAPRLLLRIHVPGAAVLGIAALAGSAASSVPGAMVVGAAVSLPGAVVLLLAATDGAERQAMMAGIERLAPPRSARRARTAR